MVATEITLEEALLLAEREIERQIAASPVLSGYQFSPVRLKGEDERSWVFVSGSEQLQDEGYVPGALYARVDKRDGHIWSPDELANYLERQAAEERSSQAA